MGIYTQASNPIVSFVSPDRQCQYKLQFVDLNYCKQHNQRTTKEKMASIPIKGNAFPWNQRLRSSMKLICKGRRKRKSTETTTFHHGTLYTFLKDKEVIKHNPKAHGSHSFYCQTREVHVFSRTIIYRLNRTLSPPPPPPFPCNFSMREICL